MNWTMQAIRVMLAVELVCVLGWDLCADGRPNVLWISCEDIGPHLGCYGHPQATTPHLDRLAAASVRYANASSVAGVCAVSRAAIITGIYPSSLGNQFMRCAVELPTHAVLFPQYLRDAGYYCTNNVKTDYNVTGDPKRCWDDCSSRAHWRNRRNSDQPFFAVFNFTNTHESQVFGYRRPTNLNDNELHDPERVVLPPYFPDTQIVRRDWAHYLDNISSMDKLAGQVLQDLSDDGLDENTLVFFWSDHGAGLPRNKRWLYESGTHVPLIVRIPDSLRHDGQGQPGSVADELVSLIDLAPTVLHLAGIPQPPAMQGQPFLGGQRADPRKYVFTIRDRMDERYDMIRGVRSARFKYLRNYQPYRPYAQILNYMEQEHTMQELRRLHAANQLSPVAALWMADSKPLEELYDLATDPHEIHNLVSEAQTHPHLSRTLNELRAAHRDWTFTTLDTGLIPEAELAVRARQCGTRQAILQQPGAADLLVRLLDTNQLACDTGSPLATLLARSGDSDAAVRYWSLIGLGNRRAVDREAQSTIKRGLRDASGSVRMAAARAAWLTGQTELALPVVQTAATTPEEFVALEAMHLIDEMGLAAKPIWNTIDVVAQSGQEYPVRIAQYLRKRNAPFR